MTPYKIEWLINVISSNRHMNFKPSVMRIIISIVIFAVLVLYMLWSSAIVCNGACHTRYFTRLPLVPNIVIFALISYAIACLVRKNGHSS